MRFDKKTSKERSPRSSEEEPQRAHRCRRFRCYDRRFEIVDGGRTKKGEGPRRISASRGGPAASRHRRDSFPRMTAVGGFFLIFEPIRAASRRLRGATGQVLRSAPKSGHRRSFAAAGRRSMRRRRCRGPGRLRRAEPCRCRGGGGPVHVVASSSARTASGAVNRPPLRHRRDACDVAPRLSGCQQHRAAAATGVSQV